MADEIIKQKQLIARLENQVSIAKLKKRRADTRRKIEYGGLVIKSGMHAYTKDIILGALVYVEQLIANDFDYVTIFESEAQKQFLEI